jgi:hypothetical protein
MALLILNDSLNFGHNILAIVPLVKSRIRPKYLPLNNRHTFGRLFFYYTSLLFTAIVKTITENDASSSKKIAPTKNDDYLTLGTYKPYPIGW